MARHKTQSNTNRITICVDDTTKSSIQTAANLCDQELLDFVYSSIYGAVLTVSDTHKVPLPI